MLVAGVRYRFANGLRAAMRIWGALIVGFAVAEGLHAAPPLVAWGHAWMATPFPRRLLLDGGVALVFGVVARSMFASSVGSWGLEQLAVLPLTRAQRFAIDYFSTLLFLLPPTVAAVLICSNAWPVFAFAVASAFGGNGRRAVSHPSSAASRHLLPEGEGFGWGYEWGWLLRVGEERVLFALGASTLAAASSYLAIRNNDVVAPLAVLRIESSFVAFAAGVLASAIITARNAARPYRVSESLVPISSPARINALLVTSLPLMVAPLAAVALLRFSFGALLYGALAFVLLLLIGEARGESVAMAVGVVAAVGGALDARVALVVVIAMLPFAWRHAVFTDATRDLRVIRSEAAA
ncbi:MAG: hypothetical protein QOI24_3241 [Acidobacteriota bacterium]|jgi:hypothetical protein|nr:hypothetical protein [Acidobacteriota bacterium]